LQGLDAGQTPARPRKLAALLGDRRGPRQRLDTRCTPETLPVVAPSCQILPATAARGACRSRAGSGRPGGQEGSENGAVPPRHSR
jgi:hypothetical protein